MSERREWKRVGWLAAALAALWLGALAVAQEGAPPPPPEGAEAMPPPDEPGVVGPDGGPGAAAEGQPGAQDTTAQDTKTEPSAKDGKTSDTPGTEKTEAAPAPSKAGGTPPAPPVAGAADVSSPARTRAEGAAGSGALWDKYKVIAERNVFLRDRTRRTGQMRLPTAAAPERHPWQDIVLSGVSRVGKEYVAFFEDTRARATTRARVGDEVGGGRIVEMTLDGVTHERNGQRTRVGVGSTLSGEAPAAARPPAPASAAAPAPAPAPAVRPAAAGQTAAPSNGAGSAAGQSVLERLRQRRLQELNKK